MGLLDVLNGMQNGPRGPSDPNATSSGGVSPMTMAILAVLGYKALKHFTSSQSEATPSAPPAPAPGGSVSAGLPGGAGGLGDLLKGGLGGLLAGGAAGSVLSGGLGGLLNQLQQGGHSETANSWVGNGPNKQIAPGDLANPRRERPWPERQLRLVERDGVMAAEVALAIGEDDDPAVTIEATGHDRSVGAGKPDPDEDRPLLRSRHRPSGPATAWGAAPTDPRRASAPRRGPQPGQLPGRVPRGRRSQRRRPERRGARGRGSHRREARRREALSAVKTRS